MLAGSNLEQQITVLALEALAEGFDVHLLNDLISTTDQLTAPVLQQRLVQAGAVPSTLRQFIYLWRSAEIDRSALTTLQELLVEYDRASIGGLR